MISRLSSICLLTVTSALFATFGCGNQLEPVTTSEQAVVKAIAITPASPNVSVMETTQFRATASYSDGSTADITSTATWASSAAAVAPLAGHGLLTCKVAGDSTISASVEGIAATSSLKCSGPAAPVPVVIQTITITPSSPNVLVAQSEQFHAIAGYSDDSTADITSTAAWTSSAAAVAPFTGQGLLICKAAGNSTISAAVAGVAATFSLKCSAPVAQAPGVVRTIAITPSSPNLLVDQSAQFHATASYSDGSTADITSTATWTSSAAAVAPLAGQGLLLCKTAGNSTISASVAGVAATSSLKCSGPVAPVPVVIRTITITPSSPNLLVDQSAQFHAIAGYSDGTTADITSTAAWISSATDVAPLTGQGLLICKTAGLSNVSASSAGVTAIAPTTCAGPQIVDVKFVATPAVIRSNAPFGYQLLADYADKTTGDVTATASWVTDPSIASVTSAGLINCNHPGTTTISGSFAGKMAQASFTCVLRSITPKPGFVESAKTFDGPFASWLNVKTVFGAKGDGVTDDSAALQAALDSLAVNRAVLWLPKGVYVITRPLTLTGLESITILGEDPLTTTISWAGPAGGTMLTLSGCDGFNIGRLTLDGRTSAGVNLEVTWQGSTSYYPTRNLIHDSRIINTQTGIDTGWAGETTVDRVHFDHNSRAGINLGSYNALNWNVLDSLFTDNAIGVTNWYGAGAFNVTNSVFVRSTTSDVVIGNSGAFSLRNNLSVDSMKFFQTGETGAPSSIILQGNTIYHPGSTPVSTGMPGTLMLLDNQFLGLDSSFNILYSFCYSPVNFISVGNTYAVQQPFGGNIGHYTSVDETASPVDAALTWTVPTEVYIPAPSHRQVFEVPSGSSGDAVQVAIDAAVAVGGVVHLQTGNYDVTKPLEIPADATVAMIGDGALTYLVAEPSLQGPILRSYAKAFHLDEVGFWSYSSSTTGAFIELHVPDSPSTRIFCDECAITEQSTASVEWNGLDDAAVEFRVSTLNGTVAATVHGGTSRQNGATTLGTMGEFMASSSAYYVDLGGHLLNEDGFHDNGQGNIQFVLTGDGSVTQQGGTIEASAYPAMALNNYKGQLSLLGAATDSYLNIAQGSPANVFVSAVLQGSGISPFANSEPKALVVGLSNGTTPNNQAPSELPDTSATPGYIEHMMATARTQILSNRMPVAFDATTARITRIFAQGYGTGLRVVNATPSRVDGSYSISSTDAAAAPAGCASGEVTMAGTWALLDGGDGFFGLSRSSTILSEDNAAQGDGSALIMPGAMSSARDRWIIKQVGDGSVTISNRATGDLLTRAPEGCAYAAKDDESATQHWLINGTN